MSKGLNQDVQERNSIQVEANGKEDAVLALAHKFGFTAAITGKEIIRTSKKAVEYPLLPDSVQVSGDLPGWPGPSAVLIKDAGNLVDLLAASKYAAKKFEDYQVHGEKIVADNLLSLSYGSQHKFNQYHPDAENRSKEIILDKANEIAGAARDMGFDAKIYEAKSSKSTYIFLTKNNEDDLLKIRISDHVPGGNGISDFGNPDFSVYLESDASKAIDYIKSKTEVISDLIHPKALEANRPAEQAVEKNAAIASIYRISERNARQTAENLATGKTVPTGSDKGAANQVAYRLFGRANQPSEAVQQENKAVVRP